MLCLCWRLSGGGSARPSSGSGAFDGASRDTMGTVVSATATLGCAQDLTFYCVLLIVFFADSMCALASKTDEIWTTTMYGHSKEQLVTI